MKSHHFYIYPKNNLLHSNYVCDYTPPDDLKMVSGVNRKTNIADPWNVFYNEATFSDILKPFEISRYYFSCDPKSAQHAEKCFKQLQKIREYENSQHTIKNALLVRRPPQKLTDKDVVMLIGRHPHFLTDNSVRAQFIKILEKANYGTSQERIKYKTALQDYFMPAHEGGKKPMPSNLKSAYEIMGKLAKHLSDKCKPFSENRQEWDLLQDKDIVGLADNINEPRLIMPSAKLKELHFTPKGFALNLLAEYFEVSTSTLKRLLKEPSNS